MKKILLLIAAVVFTTNAYSQRNVEWGIKGGLNLSTLTKIDDAKMKPSIYVGGLVEIKINDWLSIQPELIYSRQGFKSSYDDLEIDDVELAQGADIWARFNYINLPVMVKLYVWDNLSLEVGPQFGVMLNSKVKVKSNGKKSTYDYGDYVEGDSPKNFDVSFGVGLSYKFWSRFDVSARYNIGLTKVIDYDKAKNSVLQLGVGYRF